MSTQNSRKLALRNAFRFDVSFDVDGKRFGGKSERVSGKRIVVHLEGDSAESFGTESISLGRTPFGWIVTDSQNPTVPRGFVSAIDLSWDSTEMDSID